MTALVFLPEQLDIDIPEERPLTNLVTGCVYNGDNPDEAGRLMAEYRKTYTPAEASEPEMFRAIAERANSHRRIPYWARDRWTQ